MASDNKFYVWVDCESTGVEFDGTDEVIEIAAVITDTDYEQVGNSFQSLVQPSDEWLSKMNQYVRNMHSDNGLILNIIADWGRPSIRPTLVDQNLELWLYEQLGYLEWQEDDTGRHHVFKGGTNIKEMLVLAGASVGADDKWMRRQFPKFLSHLHYHVNDVSSHKGFIEDFDPDFVAGIQTVESNHRALNDVYKEINEIKQIRKYMEERNGRK